MSSYFQRPSPTPGSSYLQRLTKLYSDTKQSYESARAAPASADTSNDDPDVAVLRTDFQIQQDRLLAWGMHWADVEAKLSSPSGKEKEAGGDIDIDKKIDQAGLGEVVASVMSQIKSLLDESGRLLHPEKYQMAMKGRGVGIGMDMKKKEWSQHEVQTWRALLDQLTTCIDVLYSLSEERRKDEDEDGKGEKEKRALREEWELELERLPRVAGLDTADKGMGSGENSFHPLHLDFANIDFDDGGFGSSDPPPYDASEATASARERWVGYYRGENKPVLVDFLTADCPPHVVGTADDIFEIHELGQKLCKNKSLSWLGHLRLIGFTVDPRGPRCGMVYELPAGHSHRSLQQHRTLRSAITASHNSESAQPALEDRFRLAYNLLLSVLGYFAEGDCHRHVNSTNVLLISKDSPARHMAASPNNRPDVRCPYLVQSCQDFVSRSQTEEAFGASIYRHPAHDIHNPEANVPAYDIYSLGLMLLEIGLWMPLAKLWKTKYDRRIFMERVQRIYSQKLASKCGSKYMRLVQRCLHAPAELLGKNKPEDAAAYLLEVAKELRLCCALDEEGMPPVEDVECFELLVIQQMCMTEELGEHASESRLPPMPMPGAFGQEQESGVTRSGVAAVRRKTYPEPTPQTQLTQLTQPTQPKRTPSKKKEMSALRKWPEVQIAQQDLDQWNTLLMPRLKKILQDALRDSAESCSVSLMKIGATAEAAKTTICIQCCNTAKVHDTLTKRFKPKKGWGVVILKGDVRRSGTKPKKRRARRSGAGRNPAKKPKEQKYQEKPSCGASIGAFKDNEHLPPVSFGGTILIDGEPFGMTVHHMLDEPSDEDEDDYDEEDEQPLRSGAPRGSAAGLANRLGSEADLSFMRSEDDFRHFSDLEISDDDEEGDSDSDASTIRPDYSILDGDGNEFWFLEDAGSAPDLEEDDGSDIDDASSSSSDDEDDAASVGDKFGITPFSADCEDLAVTQPAIDDVDEDFFPSEEDRDDDHLASHTFGFVYASSGIRRVVRGALKHEVDWALIRVHKERLEVGNSITSSSPARTPGNKPRPSSTSKPLPPTPPTLTSITPTNKLSALPVSCLARSSGFSSGRISQAMCLVKLHGRHSFSDSWCVDASIPTQKLPSSKPKAASLPSGRLGIPGDSGAWVYNAATGELAGHVLAYGEKLRQAYIAPMEVLFEDIRARLGAERVELPGAVEEERKNLVQSGGMGSSREVIEKGLAGLRLGGGGENVGASGSSSAAKDGSSTRKRPEVQVGSLAIGTVS